MNELKVTEEMKQLLRSCAHENAAVAQANQFAFADFVSEVLHKGILDGDILFNIFDVREFGPGEHVEYPLHFLVPGTEKANIAFTVPSMGKIPERQFTGDFLTVQTYEVGDSIDAPMKFLREARWDVMGELLETLKGSFVRKANVDGWRTILSAGFARNAIMQDTQATSGLLSKRLTKLMEIAMARYAGGNATSQSRGKLTDLFMSPEAQADATNWQLTEVDDFTRRQIYIDGELTKIYGINIHQLLELGVGYEFQNYFANNLGGSMPGAGAAQKQELIIGLDLSKKDSFKMPIREQVKIMTDNYMARQRRMSMYGYGEWGFAALDVRRVLLGAI